MMILFSLLIGSLLMFVLFLQSLIPNTFSMAFTAFLAGSEHFQYRRNELKNRKWLIPVYYTLEKVFLVCANAVAAFIDIYGKVWYSYDVQGLENLPQNGRSALLIFYHGVLPIDMIFLPIRVYRLYGRERMIRVVVDRFIFMLFPGSYGAVKRYIFPGPASRCVETLKSGHMLAIAPGGAREAMFATRRYETIWNNRIGFAKVAQSANADIIPVFTRNIRQVYLVSEFFQRLNRSLYERSRMPVVPFCGGFPVKLTTILGQPIPANSVSTAEELAKLTQERIETMIEKNQRFPARIIPAMAERFSPELTFVAKKCN